MFGARGDDGRFRPARLDLVRLALPRRVYTQSHVDRIIEICAEVAARGAGLRGLEMTYAPAYLRHFTAEFRPLASRMHEESPKLVEEAATLQAG
jgi:tryptophanase